MAIARVFCSRSIGLALSLAALTAGLNTAIWAEEITRDGDAALAWRAKMTCGTTEQGVTRYGVFEGRVYSRFPGERDRLLFNVLGVNVRQCAQLRDAARGAGFRSVSREIMIYLDPATDQILDKWKNPWTGETLDVVHVANDPVNMRAPTYAKAADGQMLHVSLRQYGDMVAASSEVPLFYENPLAGSFQKYVGGQYHAMEIFDDFYRLKDFTDSKIKRIADSRLSWVRIAKWLPWMKMGDREGLMIFNATGFSSFDAHAIPARLRSILDERYPTYKVPPPIDDTRPNQTSWTVFKNYIDSQPVVPPAR